MQKPYQEPLFRLIVSAGAALLLFAALLLHIGQVWAAALRLLRRDFARFAGKRRIRTGWIQPVSLLGAMLPPVFVVISIICVLVPQIMRSVSLLSEHLGSYSDNLRQWFSRYAALPVARLIPAEQLGQQLSGLQEQIPILLRKTYDYTASLVDVLFDIGIGAVFALYLLAFLVDACTL